MFVILVQIYDVSDGSVLDDQLFHHNTQTSSSLNVNSSGGNSCMALSDVEFGQQFSSTQPGFLSSVLPHSFVAWNPICTMANSVLNITDDISNDSQVRVVQQFKKIKKDFI